MGSVRIGGFGADDICCEFGGGGFAENQGTGLPEDGDAAGVDGGEAVFVDCRVVLCGHVFLESVMSLSW